MRFTFCAIPINKRKNVTSCDDYLVPLPPHLISNGVNTAVVVLKHNLLRLDKANDKDVVQKGRLAFKDLSVCRR